MVFQRLKEFLVGRSVCQDPNYSRRCLMDCEKPLATYLVDKKFSHATNDRFSLISALQNNVDMIEADVIIGELTDGTIRNPKEARNICIMAHPPNKHSDLSLDRILDKLYYVSNSNPAKKIGLKLDFKTAEAFSAAKEPLIDYLNVVKYPIWLNADILVGPTNGDVRPLDVALFFDNCKEIAAAIDAANAKRPPGRRQADRPMLSVGWTTSQHALTSEQSAMYTDKNVEEMVKALKDHEILGNGWTLNFPVRAAIAQNSIPQLLSLLHATKTAYKSFLTIWSAPEDEVDVNKIRQLVETVGLDSCYIDVPEQLYQKLNLKTLVDGYYIKRLEDWSYFGSAVIFMIVGGLLLWRHTYGARGKLNIPPNPL